MEKKEKMVSGLNCCIAKNACSGRKFVTLLSFYILKHENLILLGHPIKQVDFTRASTFLNGLSCSALKYENPILLG